jgi:hypothetical protein
MHAKVGEEFLAGARDHAAVLAEHDVLMPGECIGERDAKTAGDMVVAGTRDAQLLAAVPAWTIPLRRVDGDHHDAFDHARDLRRAEPEITMAALLGHRKQVRLAQHSEMLARRLRRHAGDIGEFARRSPPQAASRCSGCGKARLTRRCADSSSA